MNDWFIWMLFGHLFGDYIFQNDWMAYNKKKEYIPCVVHCIIYTTLVTSFVTLGAHHSLTLLHVILIWISHVILDATYIVERWFVFFNKNSWSTSLPVINKKQDISINKYGTSMIDWGKYVTADISVKVSFGSIIYVMVDNTLHLFMMFLIILYV